MKADGGPGSLREVIQNACSEDTIIFDSDLNTSVFQITLGRITLDKDLHIHGNSIFNNSISTFNTQQHFYIPPSVTIHLRNLILRNGFASNNGGAIENDGILHLRDMQFKDNFEGTDKKPFTNHASLVVMLNFRFSKFYCPNLSLS